jgi:phosphatidylinositol alpha-1,6-mannosyltransferase
MEAYSDPHRVHLPLGETVGVPGSGALTTRLPFRVLALISDGFGGFGGIAQFNQNFLRALAASDFIAEVVVLPRLADTTDTILPGRLQQEHPAGNKLAYILRAFQITFANRPFDIIFCGHAHMAPLAAVLCEITGAKLWIQLHGIEAWKPSSWLCGRSLRRATLLTAVSRYTRRQLLAWLSIDPVRVKILPNTVDERFIPGPKPQLLVERHALEGRKVLLSVSRLAASERYKGHDRLIKALPAVLRAHPETAYVIVGEGDDRARLEALVESAGVATAVRFVGQVTNEELPDYYRLADLFVMPSTGEGFGIVFLEASACGLPTIGGNADGSVDALAEGRIGTLVDPNDVSGLAKAIVSEFCLRKNRPRHPVKTGRFAFNNFAKHVNDLVRNLGLS